MEDKTTFQQIIVGAGWSGLTAGIYSNRSPMILESAPAAGGRARSLKHEDDLDNGQHIAIGAYHKLLATMRKIGIDPDSAFDIRQFKLKFIEGLELTLNNKPIYRLSNILRFLRNKTMSLSEKYLLIKLVYRLFKLSLLRNFDKYNDSLKDFLQGYDARFLHKFILPVTLATMNVDIKNCSLEIFHRLCVESFCKKDHMQLLLPKKDLSKIFVQPAVNYIERQGGRLKYNTRVQKITKVGEHFVLQCKEQTLTAKSVIFALPPWSLSKIEGIDSFLQVDLKHFQPQPITTIYIKFNKHINISAMQGSIDLNSQWFFNRKFCGHPDCLSIVISNNYNNFMGLSKEEKRTLILKELSFINDAQLEILDLKIITEKKATFLPTPNIEKIRSQVCSIEPNIKFIGDWSNTKLPATLEGAIRSAM